MDSSLACNGDFLTRHQQLEFSCYEPECKKNPSKLADNLRNLYLHHSNFEKSAAEPCHDSKRLQSLFTDADEYLQKYADVVDNMDTGGLNNFAEGALALCQFYKNDSSKWKTSLTEESIMQHPCIVEALAENESGSISDDFDIPLNMNAVTSSETSSLFPMKDIEGPNTARLPTGISSSNRYPQSTDTGSDRAVCAQPPRQQKLWGSSTPSMPPDQHLHSSHSSA
ncbi:hypothetical protein EGW08_002997, partial [Elysia chlorotica]